jgi:hypothetical protein
MTLREGTSLDHRTAGNPYSRIPAVRILTGIEPDATPLDWEGMTKSHSVEAAGADGGIHAQAGARFVIASTSYPGSPASGCTADVWSRWTTASN